MDKRQADRTRQIEAGDEAPDIEVGGATEAVEIGEALKGLLERTWKEQDRTKAALASARDLSAVSAHELRTPLTAMRTHLAALALPGCGKGGAAGSRLSTSRPCMVS